MEQKINSSSEEEISFKSSFQVGKIVFKPSATSEISFQPRLIVLSEGEEINLQRYDEGDSVDKTTSNLLFTCEVMSSVHARLKYSQGAFFLKDNKSTNGTFVTSHNCEKLRLEAEKSYVLNCGDVLQIGQPLLVAEDCIKRPCLIMEINILDKKSDSKLIELEKQNEDVEMTVNNSVLHKVGECLLCLESTSNFLFTN